MTDGRLSPESIVDDNLYMTLGTADAAEERFLLDEGDNRVPIGP
jgi:hypothetical protein